MKRLKECVVDWARLLVGPVYSAIHTLPKIVAAPSYWPERPRKSPLRRYLELLWGRIATGSTNLFYNAYGQDTLGCVPGGGRYLSERAFWTKVVARNYANNINSASILRDKLTFWFFCKGAGLPTPEVFAYAIHGHYFADGQVCDWETWVARLRQEKVFFFKDVFGCCARSVYKVTVIEGRFFIDGRETDLKTPMRLGNVFLAQKQIVNHEVLQRINPASVNTIRFITLCTPRTNDDPVLVVPPLLRVGTTGVAVDNWATGGLAIAIDGRGCLKGPGFYKPGHEGHEPRVAKHPVSGIRLDGIPIPEYVVACDLVLRAHGLLRDLTIVGWDVAITPEGPVLIEGNDNPEISLHQIVAGPLRDVILPLMRK